MKLQKRYRARCMMFADGIILVGENMDEVSNGLDE